VEGWLRRQWLLQCMFYCDTKYCLICLIMMRYTHLTARDTCISLITVNCKQFICKYNCHSLCSLITVLGCSFCAIEAHNYTVGHKKTWHFTFVHIFTSYRPILKIFHWHTLRTICNNAIIIYPTTP